MNDILVDIRNLTKAFPAKGGPFSREVARVHAVRGISLFIRRGETLGLVGESGCGKTTLGLLILRLIEPDGGSIFFEGQDITHLPQRRLRPMRRQMQIVFQDPFASLNPRMTVGEIIGEPLLVAGQGNRAWRRERVMELLGLVGLSGKAYGKYPHEFSGGQRQRVGIARAIALTPKLIIADEPVSALDVSVRGEILNLLSDLRERFGLTYLFIAHDLKVVEHISHRVCVMYLGQQMESFPAEGLGEARHPYTQALVSAIPVPDPKAKRERMVLPGDAPSPLNPPAGCSFHPRCPYAESICAQVEPPVEEYAPGFYASCHLIKRMEKRRVGAIALPREV
jgi:oligopeptide/dipeptide ABC transporter ATP-binding protein